MREINVKDMIPIVKKLCIDANYYIGEDVISKIKEFKEKEESPTAKNVLDILLENYELADKEQMPICQDTGVAVCFVELGQDVHMVGGDFTEAVNEGVRQGYKDGYLRKSMVSDPIIDRINTKDNTPAIIYTDIVPGDKIKITIAPKGGGSENMSEVKMMKAADGIEGVIEFVVDRISRSGGNPCPPIIVGVGLGGNFEQSALLAKKSLLRSLTEKNPDPKWAKVEEEILAKINNLGIGPQGLGGRTTALGVFILSKPCHIASMPVAVNVQCHAARHKSVVI
ncbi:MAG: fumarate hydratase [Candidatus Cloacimonetes bacterium]|jgi:fumarate hydratase subunit alpha|nr:fumarate hydratase [Candidatus Cloacimonadota bacterium]